jgi:hypothetical protein
MDSNSDIHDCVYRAEEWSRQIKQWIDADKANLELVNQFILGVSATLLCTTILCNVVYDR